MKWPEGRGFLPCSPDFNGISWGFNLNLDEICRRFGMTWRRFFPVFQDLAGIAKTVRTKMQVEKNDVEATWDRQRIQKNMPISCM